MNLNKIRSCAGFTLTEIIVIVTVIGVLASAVYINSSRTVNQSFYPRTLKEFDSIHRALEVYYNQYLTYPDDASRDVAPTSPYPLLPFLGTGAWPRAVYPGGLFDWDTWTVNTDTSGNPIAPTQIYQISVRFCPPSALPQADLTGCTFPNEPWAAGLNRRSSALYYCIEGPCRALGADHLIPGYCVNC